MLFRACFQHLYDIERRRIPPTPADDLRLHRLERPVEWPYRLVERLWAEQPPVNLYPDYAPFYERLSAFVGQPVERLVVGAGIEDFIRSLVMLCCDPGDVVAFTWPTCAMFDIYARVFGARAAHIVAHPAEPFLVDDLLRQLPNETRLLILPNPGQPVETYFTPAEMRLVATHCQKIGAVLAVDEAYYGFGARTALPLIDEFDNVVVLRTFSKAFGAAGLRVGYAMGQPSVLKPLDAVRESGEIAGPSMHAATVLMDCAADFIEPGIDEICAGRDWLRDRLRAKGFTARGSLANHVLVEVGDNALDVAGRLKERGVHVRGNSPPLERYLLVTAGPVEMMQRFYAAFCEVL